MPIGLIFYRVLAAPFVAVIIALLEDAHRTELSGLIFILAVAIPVGAIGSYMRELVHRQ
ncbi:MAG: hypothetical protein MO846_04520 [Candidatus Devosia symbiotica]|nr:hypothetical protein [Candidatus Devosia symbiotica]